MAAKIINVGCKIKQCDPFSQFIFIPVKIPRSTAVHQFSVNYCNAIYIPAIRSYDNVAELTERGLL